MSVLRTDRLTLRYHGKPAFEEVSLSLEAGKMTAIVGPSGCGKTSFLNCLNRLTDLIPGAEISGSIRLGDQEITITSFVREFRGPDAHIECTMLDEGGKTVSRCLMIVACVDKQTNRSTDWPAEATALFFQGRTG